MKDKGQSVLTSFINNGNHALNAIVLLYNKEGGPLAEFELTERQTFIRLNDHLTQVIQDNLVDIVVYGHRAPFDRCRIYERFASKLEGRKYALREFDLHEEKKELSLNRCTYLSDRIIPEAFKLGTTTPGQENDCSGVNFIMEAYAPELFNTVPDVREV